MKKTVTLLAIIISMLLVPSPIYDIENVASLKVNSSHVISEEEVSVIPNDVDNVTCSYSNRPSDEEYFTMHADKSIDPYEKIAIDIPTHTYSKTYEDGRLITDRTSPAYQMLSQCDVDYRGHYMYDNLYYAVAMGNYFDDVGSKYIVTLEDGNQFKVIKCDVKQDRHTTNRMLDQAGAMIEFIINDLVAAQYYGVDTNGYILGGSFNNCDNFQGRIASIEQIKE